MVLKAEEDESLSSSRTRTTASHSSTSKSSSHSAAHTLDEAELCMVLGAATMVLDSIAVWLWRRHTHKRAQHSHSRQWNKSNRSNLPDLLLSGVFAVGAVVFVTGVGMKATSSLQHSSRHHEDRPREASPSPSPVAFHATMQHLAEGIAEVAYGLPLALAGLLIVVVVVVSSSWQELQLQHHSHSSRVALVTVTVTAALGFVCVVAGTGVLMRGVAVLSITDEQEEDGSFHPHEVVNEGTAIAMAFSGVLCLLLGVLCLLPVWALVASLKHRYQRLQETMTADSDELPGIEDGGSSCDINQESVPEDNAFVSAESSVDSEANVEFTSPIEDSDSTPASSRSLSAPRLNERLVQDARATKLVLFVCWLLFAVFLIGSGGSLVGVSLPAIRSGRRTEVQRHSRSQSHGTTHRQDGHMHMHMRPCDAMLVAGAALVVGSFAVGFLSRKAPESQTRYGYWRPESASASASWIMRHQPSRFFCFGSTGQSSDPQEGKVSAQWRFAVDVVMIIMRGSGVGLLVAGSVTRYVYE